MQRKSAQRTQDIFSGIQGEQTKLCTIAWTLFAIST